MFVCLFPEKKKKIDVGTHVICDTHTMYPSNIAYQQISDKHWQKCHSSIGIKMKIHTNQKKKKENKTNHKNVEKNPKNRREDEKIY